MDRRKKIVRILLSVFALVLVAGACFAYYVFTDAEAMARFFAKEVKLDEAEALTFRYEGEDVKRLRPLYFVPEESGEYQFTVSDIVYDENEAVGLYVANSDFTEYLVADNYIPGDKDQKMSGSTFLQKGEKCYIMCVIICVDETETKPFDGSLNLTVSKKPEYEEPALLTEDEDAIVTIKAGSRACARFIPQETGYFRFDTAIVSEDASSGFSMLSSIISPDNLRTQITDGIAYLEKDKEYYVWATVHETGKGNSEVSISVKPMGVQKISGPGEIVITEDTLIEYHAENSGYMAVFSSSDGNPNALIYETPGIVLRTDEDGEDSISENDKDFAMVIGQKEGTVYSIAAYGDLGTECRVLILPYTGDGSTLTIDDVDMSVLEDIKSEEGEEAADAADAAGADAVNAADGSEEQAEPAEGE